MILIFVSITKKIEVDRNGCEYILLRIVVYFTEYLLAVEINEKKLVERDLIFEEKWQKALEKKLGYKFIWTNTSKKRYDTDYEASRTQIFINKFKDRQSNKWNKISKEVEDKTEKWTGQITQ